MSHLFRRNVGVPRSRPLVAISVDDAADAPGLAQFVAQRNVRHEHRGFHASDEATAKDEAADLSK
jgi:hypothetical protein